MSVPDVIPLTPALAAAAGSGCTFYGFRDLSVSTGTDSRSVTTNEKELVVNKSKVEMCTTGSQTEITDLDLTLPLWMVSLPSFEFSIPPRSSLERGSRLVPFEPLREANRSLGTDLEELHRPVGWQFAGRRAEFQFYQSMSAMKEYERRSFEELRLADMAPYPAEATVIRRRHAESDAASSSTSSFSSFTPESFPYASAIAAMGNVPRIKFNELQSRESGVHFPLYSDAIQVILRYLNLEELLSTLRLSKQWYQAVKASQSLGMTSQASSFALARIPANSVIARHIAHVVDMDGAIRTSHNVAFRTFSLFPHLGMLLPNLKRLEISTIKGIEACTLPPHLETVILSIALPCNALIRSVGQLKQLRELQLCLQVPLAEYACIDYSPLIGLPQLEKVVINSSQIVAETRVLASLARFVRHSRIRHFSFNINSAFYSRINPLSMYFLEPTPDEPSFPLLDSGNLTSIGFPNMALDRGMLRVLSHYPGLTKLTPRIVDPMSFMDVQLLARLPRLTQFACGPGLSRSEDVVPLCEYLPNLRSLHIQVSQMDEKGLDGCLSHLFQLTELEVVGSIVGPFIAELVKYDLPKRLIKLRLARLHLTVGDLRDYILPLQQLESLDLHGTISEPIPDELMTQLRTMPNMAECNLQLTVGSESDFQRRLFGFANGSSSPGLVLGAALGQGHQAQSFSRPSFGFGAPAPATATAAAPGLTPSKGFSFGPPATPTSGFGFPFGATPIAASTGVSFGAPAPGTASATATATTTGLVSAASTGFGVGFGGRHVPSTAPAAAAVTATASAPGTGFRFGAASTAANSGFGFSSTAIATASGLTPTAGFNFGPPASSTNFGRPGFGVTAPSPPAAPAGATELGTGPVSTPSTGSRGFGFGGPFPSTAPAASVTAATTPALGAGFSFGAASTTANPGFGSSSFATPAPSTSFVFGAAAAPASGLTPSRDFSFGASSSATTPSTGFGFGVGAASPPTSTITTDKRADS